MQKNKGGKFKHKKCFNETVETNHMFYNNTLL